MKRFIDIVYANTETELDVMQNAINKWLKDHETEFYLINCYILIDNSRNAGSEEIPKYIILSTCQSIEQAK